MANTATSASPSVVPRSILFLVAAALLAAHLVAAPAAEGQTGNPYERGPAPTVAGLEAAQGPFATASYSPTSTPGFGSGTIWYPANTTEGPFAAISVSPGFLGNEGTIAWLGPRLAAHGFVVITITTNSPLNQPPSRAAQLVAALDLVAAESADGSSPIAGMVDPDRRGVMGHSMGGGGALIAARDNPTIDAAIPLAPWNTSTDFSAVDAPTLVIACEDDVVAPVGLHAAPFYSGLTTEKSYMEFADEDHFCVTTANGHEALMGRYIVSWMKAWLDHDIRYTPFLCGAPHQADLSNPVLSDYAETCPFDNCVAGGPGVGDVDGDGLGDACDPVDDRTLIIPGYVGAAEGDSGSQVWQIPITLDAPSSEIITVEYAPQIWSGTGFAEAGVDYVPVTPGTLVFLPGETSKTVPITILGDTEVETPLFLGEWVTVRFFDPSANARIEPSLFGLAVAIIGDDD